MENQTYKTVNDHVLTQEELNALITEKFERLKKQIEVRQEVDNKHRNVLEFW